jgi:hypothetical protein
MSVKEKDQQPTKKVTGKKLGRSAYELPDWFPTETHAHRWINSETINSRSDGYDPRGWVPAKNPKTNEILRYRDVILAQMPLEEYEARVQEKAEATQLQTQALLGGIGQEVERLSHEVKKLGGKIKFNLDIN